MRSELLCDNDVILKACCYDLSIEVVLCLGRIGTWFILGSASFVIADRIKRSNSICSKERAVQNFALFREQAKVIEPSDAEISLAAELETVAQQFNLALDSGESLLLAVLVTRDAVDLLLTGDKRAIQAIEALGDHHELVAGLRHAVACLEQLFLSLLKWESIDLLQNRVCSERMADVALTICFSCASGQYTLESIRAGLASYVAALRPQAKRALVASDDL
jgi:hypothetical protein